MKPNDVVIEQSQTGTYYLEPNQSSSKYKMGLISDRRNKARKEKEAAAAQAAILQVKNGYHHNGGGGYQHHLTGPHGIIPTNHHPIIHHQNPFSDHPVT